MITQICVNLPVESLPRSVAFFTAMGLRSIRPPPMRTPPA
jgi:predicted lactoylglutathione lyase